MPGPRVRISTDGVPDHPVLIHYSDRWGANVDIPLHSVRTIPSHFDEIDDVVGIHGVFNPVKQLSIVSSAQSLVDYTNIDDASITILDYPMPWVIDDPTLTGLLPYPSEATVSNWSVEALNSFNEQVPTVVSLPNFLYELRDIKGMLPEMKSSISKTASSNFLAFEFGVRPFVSDVKNLMSLTESVRKRLQHLRETQGKETRLGFRRSIPDTTPEFQWRKAHPEHPDGANIRWRKLSYSGEFRITGRLFQNLDDLDSSLSFMKAFAAASGFNNPAAVVWEAIPYSFVVDWFFRLDKQIERLAIQPFGGEYRVFDVGYSLKEEWTFIVSQNFFPEKGNPITDLGTVGVRRYQRFPGFPMSSLLLTNGTLNPKQLLLGLALLEQRRR